MLAKNDGSKNEVEEFFGLSIWTHVIGFSFPTWESQVRKIHFHPTNSSIFYNTLYPSSYFTWFLPGGVSTKYRCIFYCMNGWEYSGWSDTVTVLHIELSLSPTSGTTTLTRRRAFLGQIWDWTGLTIKSPLLLLISFPY